MSVVASANAALHERLLAAVERGLGRVRVSPPRAEGGG
jgi:hypothetical protein